MLLVGVIWSYITFEHGQGRGWTNAGVWSRACLAGVFFLQATVGPSERQGFRQFLRDPKGLLITGLLIASVALMLVDRR